jgi:hypothetical protein
VTGENYKKATNEHNHGPDPASNEAQIVREKIRKSAVSSEERPRAIIQACSSNISEEACVQIQSYDAARRTIQRQRNKILTRNTTRNKNISEIDINEEYKKTDRGENFLLYDSGNNDNNRIIMFGTARNIALLNEFPHWCVDGTFKVAPQFFTQVYTVHALINNRALPMIYVLLNNKQQATYKRVFEKLMEIEPTLRPESIVSDFEISAINAINEVFPNAQITGCMFHLAQNLWKKIQKTHLVECYRENEDTRKKCKMLLALSYVPVKDVQFAFEIITENFPDELKPLIDYWENYYVGRRILNVRPRFEINIWNMYDRIRSDLPKTNNSVEAWHNSFQKSLDCHHPCVSKLLMHLKKEQSFTETFITRYRAGIREPKKPNCKYVQLRSRLKVLAENYAFRIIWFRSHLIFHCNYNCCGLRCVYIILVLEIKLI